MPSEKPPKVRKYDKKASAQRKCSVKREGFSMSRMVQYIQGGYIVTDKETGDEKKVGSSYGIISTIAARMGANWHTAKKYIDKYQLNDILDAEIEQAAEFTVSKMLQNVAANDNTAIAMSFRILKSKRWNLDVSNDKSKEAVQNANSLKPAADFLAIDPAQLDIPDISHLTHNGITNDEPTE